MRSSLFNELRRCGFFRRLPSKETEVNFFERAFVGANGAATLPMHRPRVARLINTLMEIIHETIPYLGEIVGCVLSHYRKKINFSYSDINSVFDDLRSECYIGLVKGLLRVSETYVDDYSKVYRYLMKVVRSHIKNALSVLLLTARVPQSRWMSLSMQEKNNLVPLPLNGVRNNNDNESEGKDLDDSVIFENFPVDDVEFRDFVARLPEPYKTCVRANLQGEMLTPSVLQKMLSLYALLLYRRLG